MRSVVALLLTFGSFMPGIRAQTAIEPPVKLAEFVVTPSRFGVADVPTTTAASLTAAEIEVLPQLGDDLFRSIARLPGLAADDFTAQFWVRGAPQTQVLARLDGLDLIEPFHLKDVEGALSIVDPAIIRRLDLATGGFTAEFGGKLAGVLTMETKSAARPLGSVGLSLTGVGANHQGVFSGQRGRWLVSARRGYPDIALKASGRDDDITPRYYDVFGKVEYDLAPAQTLSLHVLHAGDALRYARTNRPSLTSRYDSDHVWARWRGRFGDRLSGETVISQAWLAWSRDGGGRLDGFPFALRDRRWLEQTTLRSDWDVSVHERLLLRAGFEGGRGAANSTYVLGRTQSRVIGSQQQPVVDTRRDFRSDKGNTTTGFFAARVRPWEPLVLEAGVRVARHGWAFPPPAVTPAFYTFPGETFFFEPGLETQPRLNAVLSLGRATVRAAWGRHAQPKGLHELEVGHWFGGQFSYPERAEHRVLGVEHPLGGGIALRLEAYERRHSRGAARMENVDNPYELFPEVEPDRALFAMRDGRARGIEVLLSSRATGRFAWHASYAFARAEEFGTVVFADFSSQRGWFPRARDQRHTVHADVTYTPNRRWQFSAAWRFHTGWPTTNVVYSLATLTGGRRVVVSANGPVYGLRLPDYHRLDLRATRRFALKRSELRAFVDIFNAYDRTNLIGFNHSVSVTGTQVTDTRRPREQLPFLPSIGLAWEW